MNAENAPLILRLPDVQATLGLSRSTIYMLLRDDPTFPKPVRLTQRNMGWIRSAIEDWVHERPTVEGQPIAK